MIRLANADDTQKILDYVRPHVHESLYTYIDIKKYGIGNDILTVWVGEKENGLSLVMMKYHTGISIYTQDPDWSRSDVLEVIKQVRPLSVTARRDIIETLQEELKDEYEVDYGAIFSLTKYHHVDIDEPIERADESDALEIAKLVTADEGIGSYYEIQDYADQLIERMRTQMGRSYIVRKDGKIIAHIASYAECDGFAPISGLITAPEYRSGLYGAALEEYIMEDLRKEGFTVFSTVTTRLRRKLLEALGNECLGEYGKLMLTK